MTVGIVYRPAAGRNEHGDPVDTDGNVVRLQGDSVAKIGTIDRLIVGGPYGSYRTVRWADVRGDVINTDGLLGFPVDSDIQLQANDIVEANGQRWQVMGPVLWGCSPHSLTGNPARYKWIAATAN